MRVTLREVVKVLGGGTPRKSVSSYYNGGIPWVTPKDMKRPLIGESEVTLSEAGMKNSPAKLVPEGSVLVVVRSGVLKHTLPVALTTRPVTVNQDMKALTPSHNLDPSYLARLLKALQPTVLGWVRATTADNFPINNLLNLEIELPHLLKQRRIAAILDHADVLRVKRRQVLAHMDSLTQSIFSRMFEGEAWDLTLNDLADIQIGPFGSLLHQADYIVGGVSVINPMHIREGQLQPDTEFSIDEAKAASLERYRLRQGDIVLGRRGEMGRAGIAGPGHVGMLCGTGSLILRPRTVSSPFLHSVVTSPRMKSHLERNSLGATLPNLNASIVRSSPAPDAPARVQSEFAEGLDCLGKVVAITRAEAAAGERLFNSLQSRAFRGEL